MALPVITNNSPTAGSIAWTATGMAYAGVNYSIAAGNSSNQFIWWQYNNGAPAMMSSNTLPTLADADVLLFLNKGGIGALVPMMDVTDGSLLVSGSVLANAIAANQIQTYHLAADSVTTTALAAGAVTAENVAAGAITTDKLAVGTVGNSLVTNGSFEEFTGGLPIGWALQNATNGGSSDVVSGVASSGAYALRLIATGTTSDVRVRQDVTKQIPVSAVAGRKWYVAARVGAGTAVTKGFSLRVNWFTGTGANSATPTTDVASNVAVATTWGVVEGQVTPPADAAFMRIELLLVAPNVATNVYVDEVEAREVVVSAVIGDGAITTPKLVAGAVTASTIAAGAVTTTALAAGAVTASTIAAGAVTASNLAAGSVTTNAMAAGSINADRLLAGSVTAGTLAADAINGKTITGATIVGSQVLTSTDAGAVTAQMSEAAVLDYVSGTATYPGIGFSQNGSGQSYPAGMYSPDGQQLSLTQGGDALAMSYMTLASNQASLYSYGGTSITSRDNVTVSTNGPAGVVSISGNDVELSGIMGTNVSGTFTVNNQPVGTPTLIGASANLNTYVTTGNFYQNSNANAASGTNYPIPDAGLLEVYSYPNFTHQRFTGYGGTGRAFTRAMYNSAWSAWTEFSLPGAWTKLANASGWSDYTGGGGYRGGIWARQLGGNVQIAGMVVGGSNLIATLPAALTPVYSAMYPAVAVAAACGVTVKNDGTIAYLYGPASPAYVNITLTIPLI